MLNRIALLVVVVLAAAFAGTATASPTMAKPNVVQVATSAGQFKTLVALVKRPASQARSRPRRSRSSLRRTRHSPRCRRRLSPS